VVKFRNPVVVPEAGKLRGHPTVALAEPARFAIVEETN
jgi:hypothetical protein